MVWSALESHFLAYECFYKTCNANVKLSLYNVCLLCCIYSTGSIAHPWGLKSSIICSVLLHNQFSLVSTLILFILVVLIHVCSGCSDPSSLKFQTIKQKPLNVWVDLGAVVIIWLFLRVMWNHKFTSNFWPEGIMDPFKTETHFADHALCCQCDSK